MMHSTLSKHATKTYVFNNLNNSSLISLGKLADDNCTIVLDKHKINVIKNNKSILQGTRNTHDGLWDIKLPTKKLQKANVIIHKKQTAKQLVKFYHQCAFSPSISTFVQAIKNNNFHSWPGLDVESVRKYLSPTPAIAKGHLDQEQAGLQSTQIIQDAFPSHENKRQEIMASIIPFKQKNLAFMDLTYLDQE